MTRLEKKEICKIDHFFRQKKEGEENNNFNKIEIKCSLNSNFERLKRISSFLRKLFFVRRLNQWELYNNICVISQWATVKQVIFELCQEVWWYMGHQSHCGNHLQCLVKLQKLGFLRKSIFCVFGGPKKLFWAHKTLFGLRNPTFGGVILLKLFDLGHHFGDIQC